MSVRKLPCTFAAALSATLAAQAPLHEQTVSLDNTPWPSTVRATDAAGAGLNFEYDAMFPAEDAVAWGFDPANPGMHAIDGVVVALADTEFSTSNSFNLWIMTEDAVTPGQPDFANAVGFSVPSASGAAGPAGYFYEIPFASPVLMPANADVFIGVEFLPESASDQLALYALAGDPGLGASIYDIGNARIGETGHGRDPNGKQQGGYGWLVDWTALTFGSLDVQFAIAPLSTQSGFATAATTNQLSLPSSNPGGTPGYSAGLFSARQISLVQDRLGNPRADDPTLLFHNADLTHGEIVGFLFGMPSPAPIDLSLLFPGSSGTLCLDGSANPLGGPVIANPDGSASLEVAIPGSGRAGLVGADLWFTALALDFTNGVVHGAGCLVLRF